MAWALLEALASACGWPRRALVFGMCRNIHTSFNFEPSANRGRVRDASSSTCADQRFTNLSGQERHSRASTDRDATQRLVDALVTTATPKDLEVEAERRRARAASGSATV